MSTALAAGVGDFLHALGQSLAAMSLYGATHPSRTAARDRARRKLETVLAAHAPLRITFLDEDVIADRAVLHDFRSWDWGKRLSGAGVQRVEFRSTTADENTFTAWLERLHAAVGSGGSPVTNAVDMGSIRFGPVALASEPARATPAVSLDSVGGFAEADSGAIGSTRVAFDTPDRSIAAYEALHDEREALSWVQSQVQASHRIPLGEVAAVVRGLSQAMQAEHGSLLPLIALKSADEYTTVHACNVAMLAMGLAEQLSFAANDVRAIGVAALLHDIGKVRLPESILNKPSGLSETERALMQTHTIEGARLLGERGSGYGLASIVAYEHHVWANGQGGYPHFAFARTPHYVTRLVQVCDVYDALCTDRPYRQAWPRARTLHHMRLQAGRELDYTLLLDFFDLIGRAESRQGLPL